MALRPGGHGPDYRHPGAGGGGQPDPTVRRGVAAPAGHRTGRLHSQLAVVDAGCGCGHVAAWRQRRLADGDVRLSRASLFQLGAASANGDHPPSCVTGSVCEGIIVCQATHYCQVCFSLLSLSLSGSSAISLLLSFSSNKAIRISMQYIVLAPLRGLEVGSVSGDGVAYDIQGFVGGSMTSSYFRFPVFSLFLPARVWLRFFLLDARGLSTGKQKSNKIRMDGANPT